MDVESDEEALDITGEEISEGHVGTESASLNAYGSPIVRGQNVNSATARREEDVAEPPSVVDRMVRNSNFAFIASKYMCVLVSSDFNFQVKQTRLNYCRFATVKQHVAERELRGVQAALVEMLTRNVQLAVSVERRKAVEVQPVNRNPSAYARHQRTVEESQSEIQVN